MTGRTEILRRLYRMPGVMRGGRERFLVNCLTSEKKKLGRVGRRWIESVNDDLPDPESLERVCGGYAGAGPCLINGVLARGVAVDCRAVQGRKNPLF